MAAMEARALKRGRGSAPACYLEWYPYTKDRTMGLNHQMASLSCALGEAFRLGRTLLLPAQICLFALHTERWSDGGGPGERCVPITDLFDLDRLSHLVPVRIGSNDTTRLFRPAHTARVGAGWSSQRVATERPLRPSSSTRRSPTRGGFHRRCSLPRTLNGTPSRHNE